MTAANPATNPAALSASTAGLSRSYRVSRGLVMPLLLLAVWEGAYHLNLSDPRLLPPPSLVAQRLALEIEEGRFWLHLAASLGRDLSGFAIGAAGGLAVGLLLGLWRLADRALSPTFNAWKQIAVFAWIPLISVWFGVGEAAKIVFVALAAFTPVVVNTYEGVRGVDRRHFEVARVLTFTRLQVLTHLALPAAAPSIFTGLHLALIYAWLATVGAEYFMTVGPGIGGMITEGREHFHMDIVLLGVFLLGAIGYALNVVAAALEHRLLRWRRR